MQISFLFFVILIPGIQIAHPPLPPADLNKILQVNLLYSLDLNIFSLAYSSICVLHFSFYVRVLLNSSCMSMLAIEHLSIPLGWN